METAQLLWMIFFVAAGLAAAALALKAFTKKPASNMRKAPAHYISISSEDNLDTFTNAYDVDW